MFLSQWFGVFRCFCAYVSFCFIIVCYLLSLIREKPIPSFHTFHYVINIETPLGVDQDIGNSVNWFAWKTVSRLQFLISHLTHHLSKAMAGTVIICTFCESFKGMCGHLFYWYAVAETQIEFRNLKFRNSETSIEFKKPLKYWNLGVKCCNCCNCFIVFMILACYI